MNISLQNEEPPKIVNRVDKKTPIPIPIAVVLNLGPKPQAFIYRSPKAGEWDAKHPPCSKFSLASK